jgi:hypothetical protein
MNIHPKRNPDIPKLLGVLTAHQVRYVITGSVAAQVFGVELEPRDLDITPALDQDNLLRLIRVLTQLEATPESFGHWEIRPDGEKKWIEENATPEALANWQPDLNDLTTLDHLFLTRHGNFDIVPELAGDYEILSRSAVQKMAFGYRVWVAHVDELLTKLTVPRREKDAPRVKQLREIQRELRVSRDL